MHFAIGANALLGLLAAALWGGGDFAGSIAVRRRGSTIYAALPVIAIGHTLSLAFLLSLTLGLHIPVHMSTELLWAVGGGAVSGVSLVAFYLALASGHMGSAAAVSGLLCAAVPAVVSGLTEGAPGWHRLVGFALAAAAIWLIASSAEDGEGASRRAMLLSSLGGLGFGFYFVALKIAGSAGLMWPMVGARVGSDSIVLLLLIGFAIWMRGKPVTAPVPAWRNTLIWIVGGATLDTGGNISFLAAARLGRLDVAAVLASIYPAGTILLAAAVLHEKTTRRQQIGMALALPAVVFITL